MNPLLDLRSGLAAVLRGIGLYHPLRDRRRARRFAARSRLDLAAWEQQGRPSPPPAAIKHARIRNHAQRVAAQTLVETGTFYGDTLFALRDDFQSLHSIELAPELHRLAGQTLGHLHHIHLHLGDSAVVLPLLLSQLKLPVLFWLDGHFCAGPSARSDRDTPVTSELACLLTRPTGHDVVLIDDARLFNGQDDYPSLDSLRAYVVGHRPDATFTVEDDIICIAPV